MQNWCLYCSQLPDRKAAVAAEFAKHGLKMNWWHSIHARTFGIQSVGWAPTAIDPRPHHPNRGQVGLTLGWWNLWQHLHLSPDRGPFLCFEDDAVLCDDFWVKFIWYYKQLPNDWEIAWVGTTGHHSPKEMHENHGGVVRCITGLPGGTHALLIRKSALPVLMANNHFCQLLVDEQLEKTVLNQLRCYAFKAREGDGIAEGSNSLVAQGSHLPTTHARWCPDSTA